jgi:hypothetical protein
MVRHFLGLLQIGKEKPMSIEMMNVAMKAVFEALENKPRSRSECQHPSNVDEGKDFWQMKSSRRIAAYLYRVTYECQVCGEWKTIIEESPKAP